MEIFHRINQSGTTIVMATHNKDIVDTMQRRVIAISDERLSVMWHREVMTMKFSTSEYFIKEVYLSFKRNTWMTLASILTVVLSLFILGFFSIAVLNLNKLANTLESQVQVSVYLKDDINKEDLDETKRVLENIEGTQSVKYITRDEAMKNFKDRLGDQQFLLDALDNTNPLPDSFSVVVTTPEQVKEVADVAQTLFTVESVSYSQDIINHIFNLTHLIRIVGSSFDNFAISCGNIYNF